MFTTKIEILRKSDVRDKYNERVQTFETIMCCDAERTMNGGRENLYASRIVNENEIAYSIRWREGITPSMFIRESGKTIPIRSIYEEGRRYRIHIVVKKTDSDDGDSGC